MSSLLVNTTTLWACTAVGHINSGETFRRGFELCLVAHDPGESGVARVHHRTGQSLLVRLPAAISSSDLKRAKAITKGSWYMLSGNPLTSTLLLKLRSRAVAGFRATLDRVISRGDQIALLLHGEAVGVLMFNRPLAKDEIAIDASFFSDGTEKEKESDTRHLADQINSTLY